MGPSDDGWEQDQQPAEPPRGSVSLTPSKARSVTWPWSPGRTAGGGLCPRVFTQQPTGGLPQIGTCNASYSFQLQGVCWEFMLRIPVCFSSHTFQTLKPFNRTVSVVIKVPSLDLPGGAVVKNPPANAGAWVQSLAREDPTCRGATEPMRHNY